MPQNAYIDELPLDLQLDLLVDGELAEPRRRALLAALDGQPGRWRAVGLRFLQHQTEKQTVGALMAGGRLVPVADAAPAAAARGPIIGRIGWRRITTVAAGLLIAASSALVTLVAVRPSGTPSAAPTAEFHATLPAELVESDRAVPVSVPVVTAGENAAIFPVSSGENRRSARTTILVQPDGNDGYMVIPVNLSRTQVY
jgi:hypothetical protein